MEIKQNSLISYCCTDHIVWMITVVFLMSEAQKHPLLESTRCVDIWFLVANDSHLDDEEEEDEKAHNHPR